LFEHVTWLPAALSPLAETGANEPLESPGIVVGHRPSPSRWARIVARPLEARDLTVPGRMRRIEAIVSSLRSSKYLRAITAR
jgi:hypothetical protein